MHRPRPPKEWVEEKLAASAELGGDWPPPPPTKATMVSVTYYCRYHGRVESTGYPGACLTTQQIWDEREAKQKRTDDPPCLWARFKMALGFVVKP